jgi:hypothetical protein
MPHSAAAAPIDPKVTRLAESIDAVERGLDSGGYIPQPADRLLLHDMGTLGWYPLAVLQRWCGPNLDEPCWWLSVERTPHSAHSSRLNCCAGLPAGRLDNQLARR